MISTSRGQSPDSVWLLTAEAFRRSEGVRAQDSAGGSTREILHVATSTADPRQRWCVSRQPPLSLALALAEIVWIMTGRHHLAEASARIMSCCTNPVYQKLWSEWWSCGRRQMRRSNHGSANGR